MLIWLIWTWLQPWAFAQVEVAFVEMHAPNGALIQLEPGGRFAHVAIRYEGKWLHAYPGRRVEVISDEDLGAFGEVTLLTLDQPEVSRASARKFLGKPYDSRFSWNDSAIYCSELVGKLLGVPPEPMSFAAPHWPEEYRRRQGELGLSPDDLYNWASRQ